MPVAVAERVLALHTAVPTEPHVLAEGCSPGACDPIVPRVVYCESCSSRSFLPPDLDDNR